MVDGTFNKSACLDLESFLIRHFAGDGKYEVLNRNEGITYADYYGRDGYQSNFEAIFEELRGLGFFTRSVKEIENTDLFKLSPFKALTHDQSIAVSDILEGFFEDLTREVSSEIVIKGDPGTGKTVVGIYLMKLLSDIRNAKGTEPADGESLFSDFFTEGHPELLHDTRVALVVPQQSLRQSIRRVFKKTPGLAPSMVLSPFDVGKSAQLFDLLIVDEAHRLSQRARQASGMQNRDYVDINIKLFGRDETWWTQLDWIRAQSQHQIYLVDSAQSVRPGDVPTALLEQMLTRTQDAGRLYRLISQHRVKAGSDYVGYVRNVLADRQEHRMSFGGYDLRFFDDLESMRSEIVRLNGREGLARLLAGYAWRWKTKKEPGAFDIEIGEVRLRWNGVTTDWVDSPTSIDEVGSIHTIQGYDLNYAGVIIGPDLRFDPVAERIYFDRDRYFDSRGKSNNSTLGLTYTDDDLLGYVRNIYAVLLTRGILGTFIYVCDPALRERLRSFF
ncbi:DNA/RNA helicase domain-containing protein [Aeromicrobium sp. CF4.19]|uniref:DNA/RNA helicase domain-containing protein n=1 Tax=Aeromicrobium sp. CF4.19 TaxID=3373082 RepID=UPI003EE64BE7